MKQTIYILTLTFGLLSCIYKTAKKTVDQKSNNTIQTVSVDKEKFDIYIKDKSQYGQAFINRITDFKHQIKLIDNYFSTDTDTTYFPEDLFLNKKTTFTASKNNKKFLLTLTRTNFTNINYEFQLIDKGNAIIDSKSGQEILSSSFLFAPEGEPDPESGISFVSNEYQMKNENFWIVIKVGMDKDYDGKKRAKIIYGQILKSKMKEPIMESPILRIE